MKSLKTSVKKISLVMTLLVGAAAVYGGNITVKGSDTMVVLLRHFFDAN